MGPEELSRFSKLAGSDCSNYRKGHSHQPAGALKHKATIDDCRAQRRAKEGLRINSRPCEIEKLKQQLEGSDCRKGYQDPSTVTDHQVLQDLSGGHKGALVR